MGQNNRLEPFGAFDSSRNRLNHSISFAVPVEFVQSSATPKGCVDSSGIIGRNFDNLPQSLNRFLSTRFVDRLPSLRGVSRFVRLSRRQKHQNGKRRSGRGRAARTRTQELLSPVEQALSRAGIDHNKRGESIPDSPTRAGNSAYKRIGTRLFFEDLTLRQLAEFACGLQRIDPTLVFESVHLVMRHNGTPAFDVEASLHEGL